MSGSELYDKGVPGADADGTISGEAVLEARNFVKRYGELEAVRGVSLKVRRGEIFGLIGPDGGGKTSLMRSMVSLLNIDGGELFVLGRSVAEEPAFVRRSLGYMPQRFSLYQDLSVEENLRFFASLFGVGDDEYTSRRAELYGFSGLAPFARRRAGALSGGMKQKLALSCMLVHSPEVVVLDEPTFGVDPVSRAEFWDILAGLRDRGTSIFVSTAYMDEAAHCDEVALMFEGRILAVDRPENLPARYPGELYAVSTAQPHRAYRLLSESGLCARCDLFGDGPHFSLAPGSALSAIGELLADAGLSAEAPRRIDAGIEDLFLLLMGGGGGQA
jgi:ABC-2 type transport system ATP-binding protein